MKSEHLDRLDPDCLEALDFNLSAGRHKPFTFDAGQHRPPAELITELQALHAEVQLRLGSRARDTVPGKPFAASYRLPMNEEGAAPEQRDDVKAERMKYQRTRAAGKR